MTTDIDALITALKEKGALLDEMYRLLEEEQNCIVALDMARLEANQSAIDSAMVRMERLNVNCRALLAKAGDTFGLDNNGRLTPLIERTAGRERLMLQGLQKDLTTSTTAVDNLLSLNRGLLQDSLGIVDRSLNFFNGLFNSPTTYGEAGRMKNTKSGARLVCKEI